MAVGEEALLEEVVIVERGGESLVRFSSLTPGDTTPPTGFGRRTLPAERPAEAVGRPPVEWLLPCPLPSPTIEYSSSTSSPPPSPHPSSSKPQVGEEELEMSVTEPSFLEEEEEEEEVPRVNGGQLIRPAEGEGGLGPPRPSTQST